MTAQPDTPDPDTGSYEVIHLGGQAAVAFLDDPLGIRAVLDAIDRLADDPRPAGSFPYGSPDLRRLRVDRYRILCEITDKTVAIRHIARGTRN